MNDKRLFIMPMRPAQLNRANIASAYFELKFLQHFQSPFATHSAKSFQERFGWKKRGKIRNSDCCSNSECWSKAMCVNDTECTRKRTKKERNSLNYIVLIIFCVTTNLSKIHKDWSERGREGKSRNKKFCLKWTNNGGWNVWKHGMKKLLLQRYEAGPRFDSAEFL